MRIIKKIAHDAPTPKLTRVAAYARVSDGKDSMLHSLSAQVSYYSELIQRRPDWLFAGVYADEAISGTKDSRAEFQRLLTDCRAGLVDYVITKSISRFARNTVTLLETVRELKSLGIGVLFEEQNINTLSAEGELMLTILAGYAQEESRSVSENCNWRIKSKFENGETVGFNGMYGYRYEDGEITIDEAQAEVVRRIFEWYIGGDGFTKIAARLNADGVLTYLGGKWTPSRVGFLLGNEKLTGNAMLGKSFTENHLTKRRVRNTGERNRYYAEDTHPAIISVETYEKAQAIRLSRAERSNCRDSSGNRYPFSGKIVCGLCGKHYKRHKNNARWTWQCGTYLAFGRSACASAQVPEDTLTALAAEVGDWLQIRVSAPNEVEFTLADGSSATKTWQYRSRRESWTDEMRAQAAEHARKRYDNG